MKKAYDQSKQFFDEFAEDYEESVMKVQKTLYKNAKSIIDNEINNNTSMLDVGNGGVINYNFKKCDKLTCMDLSLSKKAQQKYKKHENVIFIQGDILNQQNCKPYYNQFDVILIQYVIHHLADNTIKKTYKNVEHAMDNAYAMLKSGGKILIIESVVFPWFERIERLFYPFFCWFFRIMKFGIVYQFSHKKLLNLLEKRGGLILKKLRRLI